MTTTTRCQRCTEGPSGEKGHDKLVFQVEGPYPGHHIFRCTACDERWIRHYGSPETRHIWTCYSQVFAVREPRADPVGRKVAGSA